MTVVFIDHTGCCRRSLCATFIMVFVAIWWTLFINSVCSTNRRALKTKALKLLLAGRSASALKPFCWYIRLSALHFASIFRAKEINGWWMHDFSMNLWLLWYCCNSSSPNAFDVVVSDHLGWPEIDHLECPYSALYTVNYSIQKGKGLRALLSGRS